MVGATVLISIIHLQNTYKKEWYLQLTCGHGTPNSIGHSPPNSKQKYQHVARHTHPELQEEVEEEVDDKGRQSQEVPWDVCN